MGINIKKYTHPKKKIKLQANILDEHICRNLQKKKF